MMETDWSSRWSKDQLKTLLAGQFEAFVRQDTGLERARLAEVKRAIHTPHAIIVSGLRRVGKTTFLAQIAHRLGQDSFYYYVDFEADCFLGFQSTDSSYLYQVLRETFGERKTFILDAVQNFPQWELFVRRFMDLGFKFYLAGSLTPLPGQELGTHLTGRYVPVELFPFSFSEFIQFQRTTRLDLPRQVVRDPALLGNLLEAYLRSGGLPEALKYPELSRLRDLYNAILYRNITAHHLKKVTALRQLAFYLLSNPAGLFSLDQIQRQFHLRNAKTAQAYLKYLENSWLVLTLDVYTASVNHQRFEQKKAYCIDTGLATTIGFSPDHRKLLENLVFLALRRQIKELFACRLPGILDAGFYLPEKRQLIQISTDWKNSAISNCDVQTLSAALKTDRVESALILSASERQSFELDGIQVEVRAIAEWLASQ